MPAWPAAPGVLVVEWEGRLPGWIGSGIITTAPGARVVLIGGHLVVVAGEQEPVLSRVVGDALSLLDLVAGRLDR